MSKKSSGKVPRLVKNKEQLLADLKKSAEWVKKMDFVKNKFYPALCEASLSIDDAKQFITSIPTTIMQTMMEHFKDKNLGELNLVSKLDPADPKYKSYCQLIELFSDEKIFAARDLINGMDAEINMFVSEELKTRPLSSLKTLWIDSK